MADILFVLLLLVWSVLALLYPEKIFVFTKTHRKTNYFVSFLCFLFFLG